MPKKIPLLHYQSHGAGKDVVLLHGFLSSSAYWKKVTALVADNYRVTTIDLLGFGASPKPRTSKYDYDAHIASLEKTLEKANVGEKFILVGHSMGALISLRFANLNPTKVSKLILTNMPVMIGAKEVKEHIFRPNIIFRLGLSPITHRLMWGSLKVLYKTRLLPTKARTQLSNNIEYVFNHSPMSRLRSFRRVIMKAKAEADLAALNVRTVVLSGFEDRKIYIQNLTHNVTFGPNVSIQNFQTGHHIPLVMPEVLVKAINN